MSRVLSSFLIGIGWDTTQLEKGTRKIESSLDGVKSTALSTGAELLKVFGSIGAAALAVGAGIGANAISIDQLNLKLNKMATSKTDMMGLGTAFKLLGGNAEDAVTELDRIEQMMANFRIKGETGALGQMAFIPDAVSKDILSAKTGMEFYTRLQKVSVGLSKDQQRVLQESLGLSDASMKLLTKGTGEFNERLQIAKDLNYQSDALNDSARKYNEQWETTKTLVGSVIDQITEKMLPGLNSALGVLNEFIQKNKATIDKVGDFVTKNAGPLIVPKAIAAAVGAGVDKVTESQVVKDAAANANKMTPVIKAKEAVTKVDELRKRADVLWSQHPQGAAPSTDVRGGSGYSPQVQPPIQPERYGPMTMSAAPSRNIARDKLAEKIGDKIATTKQDTQPRFINEVNVNLDGRVIDQQITEQSARRDKAAIDDLRSTTAR